MGIEKLQSFMETKCNSANRIVDLGELAKEQPSADGAVSGAPKPLQLVVDAESCLDRLYGGHHADWVAGGQWNRMLEFLLSLRDSCAKCHIKIVVFMNGALEKQHLAEWGRGQSLVRWRIQAAMREVLRERRAPSPRLWVAPAGLRQCLRLALRHVGIPVMLSRESHRHEVIDYCREHNFDGVVASDPAFLLFRPPRYFSARMLKLSFKKELTTVEFLVDKLANELELQPERLVLLGALLGNHILTEEDLKEFHERVIADCESEPRASLVEAVSQFLAQLDSVDDLNAVANVVFSDAENAASLASKLRGSVAFYLRGTEQGAAATQRSKSPAKELMAIKAVTKETSATAAAAVAAAAIAAPPVVSKFAPFYSDSEEERRYLLGETLSPSTSVSQLMLLRHTKGLLSPDVGHILTHREIKLAAVMEDVTKELTPSAIDLYRDLRQRVYGLLLDVKGKEEEGELVVKEWHVTKGNEAERPDLVAAVALDWDVPSLERLWFGSEAADAQGRLKAFLSCFGADDPSFLDPEKVPRKYLILCAVLRYMLEFGKVKKPFLALHEFEAFLAAAVCPVMKNVRLTKEMQLRKVYTRGLTLGALMMKGVEWASLVNDACGSPVPWQLTCPWEFFDGKIFHLKLIKACSGSPLLEVCENRADQLILVERMRDAVLGNRKFEFASPKLGRMPPRGANSERVSANAAAQSRAPRTTPPFRQQPSPSFSQPSAGGDAASAAGAVAPHGGAIGVSQKNSKDAAEIYADAYATAYVNFCANKGKKASSLGEESFAQGYAAAMAAVGRDPADRAPQPRQGGFVRRQESFQDRVSRQAAAYANYHSFPRNRRSAFRPKYPDPLFRTGFYS